MGLLRDAIGQAVGAGQVQNGFNGPKLPFGNKGHGKVRDGHEVSQPRDRLQRPTPGIPRWRSSEDDDDHRYYRETRLCGREVDLLSRDESRSDHANPHPPTGPTPLGGTSERYTGSYYPHSPPPCRPSTSDIWSDVYGTQPYGACQLLQQNELSRLQCLSSLQSQHADSFRPLALPQISYGDGQPFLRGYSDELRQYGISKSEFIGILDAVNVAIIPNPEVQIGQKAARIAGFFVPGAASIGMIAGQIGVGVGAAVGHASIIGRILSEANLDLFVPKGLELCIGKSKDVDAEVGLFSDSSPRRLPEDTSPEYRIASYGDLLAPVSEILPLLDRAGRNDPIALVARGISNRGTQKKVEKAQEEMSKGQSGHKHTDRLEGGVQWLLVRRASPEALQQLQKLLQQSTTTEEIRHRR